MRHSTRWSSLASPQRAKSSIEATHRGRTRHLEHSGVERPAPHLCPGLRKPRAARSAVRPDLLDPW
jgi:hypothetical protein